jgi:hypothetical protein
VDLALQHILHRSNAPLAGAIASRWQHSGRVRLRAPCDTLGLGFAQNANCRVKPYLLDPQGTCCQAAHDANEGFGVIKHVLSGRNVRPSRSKIPTRISIPNIIYEDSDAEKHEKPGGHENTSVVGRITHDWRYHACDHRLGSLLGSGFYTKKSVSIPP